MKSLQGTKFLFFALLLLAVSGFFNVEKTLEALHITEQTALKLIPIFALVIVFTALINYFLKPKHIAQYLGKESGWKGWSIALLSGIISTGPSYLWYTLLADLRKHGMTDGLLAAFLAARAIKLPALPILVVYFGWMFTFILTILMTLFALIQGKIIDRIEQKNAASNPKT
jgi:uncharacterized membrane protein YraQ (UPF0718 family)